ncbi:type IV pilus biogenesis protein PilM [Desulfitobacterium metallireducens]|uniref:Competence protein ComA n=1 Tax=Desulfitobacterium metallireducens DSM 15288 TaxID=871968 RepID=W0EHE1_9FIRM|nr:hypothetical protein [Desulfitobacterium metallireducens]AHF08629.1 hypothetical protein DESME_10520 [Desulfitobacterium metallireducens DSM 15288]
MSGLQVCLELCERELHLLVYISESKRGKLVNLNQVKFDSRSIPGGWLEQGQVQSEMLTELLNEIRQAHKIPVNTPIRLAIPLVNGFIREYPLPWIDPKFREAAIQYLAKEETPIPQDNQVIGYALTEENKKLNRMRVTLGATRRSVLESMLQTLRGAGFKPITVEFSVTAMGNALNLQPQERYLYFSETKGGIQILLYHGILPEMTRFFPVSSGSDPQEWIDEIARIFRLINTETPIHRIFTSGQRSVLFFAQSLMDAKLPGLNQLTEISSLEQLVETWPWRKSLPQSILPCLPCLGLVLGRGQKGKTQNINLLSEYLLKKRESHQKWIVAGLILSILLSSLGLWVQGKNQQKVLQAEVDDLKTNVETQQAQQQSQTYLVNEWKEAKGSSRGITTSLISLRDLVGDGISFEHLEYKESVLTLQGTALKAGQFEQFLMDLQDQDWRQVHLHEYRQEAPSVINFTVTAVR